MATGESLVVNIAWLTPELEVAASGGDAAGIGGAEQRRSSSSHRAISSCAAERHAWNCGFSMLARLS
eukprot:3935496-Rhodomonas_salina.1